MDIQLTAGTISTSVFAASNIAMLVKAARTRSLSSYSCAWIWLTNVANLVHWLYVAACRSGRSGSCTASTASWAS